jgi:hypothetical protein
LREDMASMPVGLSASALRILLGALTRTDLV